MTDLASRPAQSAAAARRQASDTTVAGAMIEALRALGVQRAFGLPGVHNLVLWEALRESEIELIGVRHEQTAAYAADGYARLSGALGVALTTTGPGAANAVAATGEAWTCGSPVLVITTDIPAALRRPGVYRGILHEIPDQASMFTTVTKAARRLVDPATAGAELLAMGELALRAPRAPVYVEVPTDLFGARADGADLRTAIRPATAPGDTGPTDESIAAAAAVIAEARRPLIWAGRGAIASGAEAAIAEIASALDAPVLETYGARGVIDPDHPSWVGYSPHFPEVGALWDRADTVLAIGTDFDGTMTQNWALPAPPRLVSINLRPSHAFAADLDLIGDAAATTARLAVAVTAISAPARRAAVKAELDVLRQSLRARLRSQNAPATELLDDLAEAVPAGTPVTVDMCIAGYWVGAARAFRGKSRLAYPIGWGTLGFGFPASIGTAMATDGPVLCVCGDGGFLYACGELSTLAEHQPRLTVLLVDDGGYGMLRFDQQHSGDTTFGVDFPTADFVALARSFGIPATRVSGPGRELRSALTSALAASGPRMVVLDLALQPPESTGPLWYRRQRVAQPPA
jgi:thiamine pyrophosphate-dependent acetolactate synthase large subunit-like protein